LRRPAPSPEQTPRERDTIPLDRPASGSLVEPAAVNMKPVKPNFVRCAPLRQEYSNGDNQPAPAALMPRLNRPDYYVNPSIEAMSVLPEAKLSCVDNLEIGRYGYGSVKWPGLTDVRGINFDEVVFIDRGGLTLYPDRDKPKEGEELNKEAVVTLLVRPSRTGSKLKSPDVLRARLAKISEDFGGTFISYDMEKWIFRVPHFNVLGRSGGD